MSLISNRAGKHKRPVAALMRGVWLASLVALVSAPATAGTLEKIAQTGVLTIGYKIAVPFAYQDDAGRPIGYSIDLCLKVADAIKRELKRPDLVIKYATVTSASRFTDLAASAIDLECGNTTNTAERRTKAAFTIPTFIAAARLLVRADSGIKSTSNLNGKTVVTTAGSSSENLFKNLNETRSLGAKVLLTKDYAEAFAAVEEGKADAFVMDDVVLYSLRAASKEPTKYEITHDALTVEPLSIMMRMDDPAFKKLVDSEITRVILAGEINPIYRKWFESPIPPKMLNLRVPMSYMLRDSFKVPTDWLPD